MKLNAFLNEVEISVPYIEPCYKAAEALFARKFFYDTTFWSLRTYDGAVRWAPPRFDTYELDFMWLTAIAQVKPGRLIINVEREWLELRPLAFPAVQNTVLTCAGYKPAIHIQDGKLYCGSVHCFDNELELELPLEK